MALLATNISAELATAVKSAGPGVVRIIRHRRPGTSGIVWSDDGLVVTSSRALRQDDDITVVLPDGDERVAALVGRDPGTDIALLRVEGEGFTPLAFRDVADLAVGHAVLAIGRPGRSVRASLRIVGVLGDDVKTPGGGRLENYVESDRRIPAGFSGGPLIDLAGEAIGMNTRGVIRGADLAVTRATIARVVDELLAHGTMRRGYIGVAAYPVRLPDPVRATRKQRSGALVVSVEDGSPADAAGIVLGDVVVEVDGAAITGPDTLRSIVSDRADTAVSAVVLRVGALTDVTITVGQKG
jgi:S1-C subfamily serine protease